MKYPEIYLSVDNCIVSKRRTRPQDWMQFIADAGLHYVEASADNECDPLYMDKGYIQDWIGDIKKYAPLYDVKIANLYSGHGTYTTLGLAHTDGRNADRMLFEWLGGMTDIAAELDCGLGFFCHAFEHGTLQDKEKYVSAADKLLSRLARVAEMSSKLNAPVGVEQMYTPHQIPWTITGASELLNEVKKRSGRDFYLTVDTGHQSGQHKFLRPDTKAIQKIIDDFHISGRFDGVWLGTDKALEMVRSGASAAEISELLNEYHYLFAKEWDGDTYCWLKELACYSPVIHLQQTDGKKSGHLPFNEKCNASGIIEGEKVLQAIAESYEKAADPDMPEKCDKIYLTLEIFSGTADIPADIEYKLKDSVEYWRRFIPEDGMSLDKLL